MNNEVEESFRIISKQLQALDDLVHELKSGTINIHAAIERLARWKAFTVALLTKHVSKAEGDALQNKRPAPTMGPPGISLLNETKAYRAFLEAVTAEIQKGGAAVLSAGQQGQGEREPSNRPLRDLRAERSGLMMQHGKWRAVRELGAGGQGKVFLAIDSEKFDLGRIRDRITRARLQLGTSTPETLDSTAGELAEAILAYGKSESPEHCGALKVLRSAPDSTGYKKQLERMNKEVAALRGVSHPSIIRILDDKLEDGWFVMEFFPEGTLSEHSGMFCGNFSGALAAVRPIVEAVAEMHGRGEVHRDIKPENVFLSGGRLILGDLGLVYFLDGREERITDTFENVGSRDWMPGWAMGMRVDEIKPSFDVFCLGKLLWSMVSGKPRLRLWYLHEDPFELEKMFPQCTDVRWARLILDKCIVEKEQDCLPDAGELLAIVDKILQAVGRHSQVVAEGVGRICRVCGLGEYQEVRGDTLQGFRPPGGAFRVFICQNCGHSEFFFLGGAPFPAWSNEPLLAGPTNVKELENFRLNPQNVEQRVQAVDLSVKIQSGFAQNFLIEITNHSDEEVEVTRIRVESRGVELTEPAEPKSKGAWKIPPRARLPIGWSAHPDPAAGLLLKNQNVGLMFQDEIDMILQCEILGVLRPIVKKMIVQVNGSSLRISQLVG